MSRLILASASPRRRELLTRIGLSFEVLSARGEENPHSAIPEEMVQELSAGKALGIYGSLEEQGKEEAVVIGADTLVAFGNRVMGKPQDEKDAFDMLFLLQGKTHQVYTGVTLLYTPKGETACKKLTFVEKTDVTMYPMTEQEILEYIATGEPMDKAGAYGIQGKCAAYVRKICGDYNNVVGLPVSRLYQELKRIVNIQEIKA